MNSWGFAIYINNTETFADFGYETENDAQTAMQEYITANPPKTANHHIIIEQRWIDI